MLSQQFHDARETIQTGPVGYISRTELYGVCVRLRLPVKNGPEMGPIMPLFAG